MTLRAVLFDLDGTLVESHGALRTTYHAFLARTGISGDGGGFERWDGASLGDVVDRLASEHALTESREALLRMYIEIATGEYSSSALMTGAAALLDRAAGLGLRRALVTSAPRAMVEQLLERLELGSSFDATVFADDVAETKPSPEPYVTALAKLGVGAHEAVVVEDSPSGARSAASAGIACIAIGAAMRAPELRLGGAGIVVADLIEAATVVESLVRFPGRLIPARSVVTSLVGDMGRLSDHAEMRLLENFAAAARERPGITDGPIASLRSWRITDDVLHVEVERASYRHVLGRRAGLATSLHAVGVTGILRICEPGGGPAQIVIGKRSSGVTHFPGFWELVPSGGLAVYGSQVDAIAQLRAELVEEVTLPEGTIIEVVPLGLVEDVAGALSDIAYLIDALVPLGSSGQIRTGHEYEEILLLREEEIEAFLRRNKGYLVPTIRPLLALCPSAVGV